MVNVFKTYVNGIDYFETTVDLNKFESKERMGYLSRDKVIGFLAHPTLALLKWRTHLAGVCLIYRFRKEKRRLSKKRRTVKRIIQFKESKEVTNVWQK